MAKRKRNRAARRLLARHKCPNSFRISNRRWEIKARLCRESNSLHDRLKSAEQRIAELEAKLARFGDVRQHYQAGYDDGHSRGLNAGRLYKEDTGMVMHRHASANAYAAEGDEQ